MWLDSESSHSKTSLTSSNPPKAKQISSSSSVLVKPKPIQAGIKISEISNNDIQSIIKKAIGLKSKLIITYKDLEGYITTRTITPKTLFYTEVKGELALSSYCHLRREKRVFILDRIKTVKLL